MEWFASSANHRELRPKHSTEITKDFLLAALRAVALAVLVEDGLIFCVAENNCVVLSGVSLCTSHRGLLLISFLLIYRQETDECKVQKKKSFAIGERIGDFLS